MTVKGFKLVIILVGILTCLLALGLHLINRPLASIPAHADGPTLEGSALCPEGKTCSVPQGTAGAVVWAKPCKVGEFIGADALCHPPIDPCADGDALHATLYSQISDRLGSWSGITWKHPDTIKRAEDGMPALRTWAKAASPACVGRMANRILDSYERDIASERSQEMLNNVVRIPK